MPWKELKATDSTYLDASKRFCVAFQITAQASSETCHSLSLFTTCCAHLHLRHVEQQVCIAGSAHHKQGVRQNIRDLQHVALLSTVCMQLAGRQARQRQPCYIRHHYKRTLAILLLLLLLLLLLSLSKPWQP